MTKIKSLADELREQLRTGSEDPPAALRAEAVDTDAPSIVTDLLRHQVQGNDKLLIRLDARTAFLLKQLKVATGIDMVQFISFAIQQLLDAHPELTDYVKQKSLNNF